MSVIRMTPDDVMQSARRAGAVRRYHTWPTLQTQTNAEHTWNVMRLHCELFGAPTSLVWHYLLHHDSAELWTGDLPHPVKKNWPDLRVALRPVEAAAMSSLDSKWAQTHAVLTPIEMMRCKACDLLEMMEFAVDEIRLGSQYAWPVVTNIRRALRELGRADATLSTSDWAQITSHEDHLWRQIHG